MFEGWRRGSVCVCAICPLLWTLALVKFLMDAYNRILSTERIGYGLAGAGIRTPAPVDDEEVFVHARCQFQFGRPETMHLRLYGVASGRQSLKLPPTKTAFASGA